MTCQQDWEPRQPQDFVKGSVDSQLVPWIRDESLDQFTFVCTPATMTAYIGLATVGCSKVGNNTYPYWSFITPYCTYEGSSGTAGLAVAGCMLVGNPNLEGI